MEGRDKNFVCPITLEQFRDPIVLPCCGKSIERQAISISLIIRQACPMCNGDLSEFDPSVAPVNRNLLDSIRDSEVKEVKEVKPQTWSATLHTISGPGEKDTKEGYLQVYLENAKFVVKPTLYIAVCDRSGSMQGKPWEQVENALLHIIGLAEHSQKMVSVSVIMYESGAEVIHLSQITRNTIRKLYTGGGTNFEAAFSKIFEVIRSCPAGLYNQAVVCFMTDGQSGQKNSDLIERFQNMVNIESKRFPIVIHSVGFSTNCDKILLEGLRTCGTREGVFQYAAENDPEDFLCQKITGIFDLVRVGNAADITLNGRKEFIAINEFRKGKWAGFVSTPLDKVCIETSMVAEPVTIVPEVFEGDSDLFQKWCEVCIERIASKIAHLKVSNRTPISILKQQITNMLGCPVMSPENIVKLRFLDIELDKIRQGALVDIGRVYDMRFSSQFKTHAGEKGRDLEIRQPVIAKVIDNKESFETRLKRIPRSIDHPGRNQLQKAIVTSFSGKLSAALRVLLEDVNAIREKDSEGNTSLHLAAYCGFYDICEAILEKAPDLINEENTLGDTPVILAIKKNAYIKTTQLLLDKGAIIPKNRVKNLQNYVVNMYAGWKHSEGTFPILADVLDSLLNDRSVTFSNADSLSTDYIKFLYKNKKCPINRVFYEICLYKGLFDIAMSVQTEEKIEPLLTDLVYCFPKKPDDPEVEKYLVPFSHLLNYKPNLIQESDSQGDTLLHKAVEKGSLPHVKLLCDLKADVNARSALGNTPLWIACMKRYPCIIEELLDRDADPNIKNNKGNPPLYTTCQLGTRKIADIMVTRGADVEVLNDNGDTLILIACRNGQDEILELLLQHSSKHFASRYAEIDGFTPMFAATEGNRPQCIRVLHMNGFSVNDRTSESNTILQDATPLHLAAYYGCEDAARELISLGGDVNAKGVGGLTPIQLAVIQGNTSMVRMFLGAGARAEGALQFARGELREILNNKLDLSNFAEIHPYWSTYWNNVDTPDENGYTPLMMACLTGEHALCVALVRLGAQKEAKTNHLTARDYAEIVRNKQAAETMDKGPGHPYSESRLRMIQKKLKDFGRGVAARVLTLEINKRGIEYTANPEDFQQRMKIPKEPEEKVGEGSLVQVIDSIPDKGVLWYCKLITIEKVLASPEPTPIPTFLLEVYTKNRLCSPVFRNLVVDAMQTLPHYSGEVFVNLEARTEVGQTVFNGSVFSGSTLWKIAVSGMNPKTGTIGVFRGSRLRLYGGSFCEVLIGPGKYRAKAWYHYDPIALGQPNIREHTFKIRPTDVVKSVIIEFEEV